MVFPAFLPSIDSETSNDTLVQLSRIGPLLLPLSAASLLPSIASIPSAEVILDVSASTGITEDSIEALISEAHASGVLKAVVRASAYQSSSVSTSDVPVWSSIDEEHLEASLYHLSAIKPAGVIIRLSGKPGQTFIKSAGSEFGFDTRSELVKSIRKALPSPGAIFIQAPTGSMITADNVNLAHSTQTPLLIPSSQLTESTIPEYFLSILHSDRHDGLFPTIVHSPSSTPTLPSGLVYSSSESIKHSISTGQGAYHSRSRGGLWVKGLTSGSTQTVNKIRVDCDSDAILFEVGQVGTGFCHFGTVGCFSDGTNEGRDARLKGIAGLEKTLVGRKASAPEGSYTARLFNDPTLLSQKIMEEADELITAPDSDPSAIAFEAADLIYFLMVRCVKAGVSWSDVEASLDIKAAKGKAGIRRQGDAKQKWVDALNGKAESVADSAEKRVNGLVAGVVAGASSLVATVTDKAREVSGSTVTGQAEKKDSTPDMPVPASFPEVNGHATKDSIRMRTATPSTMSKTDQAALFRRPVMDSSAMIERVKPIVQKVREGGDAALASLTKQFDRCDQESNVLLPPFYPSTNSGALSEQVRLAIDQAYANVKAFHAGQAEKEPLVVETMPGVVCTRFARPIDRVGLYVPGGTAILPSTALMLGVPAQVAGCKTIVLATPPRSDGSITPEVLYVAHLVGASVILKAGGAQAVAAMAYGTETCPKVDKIFGPGNQWVTAAKMLVQNDTDALVGIDMPAGPSEVMVIADSTANPVFVASDLLSQAEHGIDSQVVLVAIDLAESHLANIEDEVEKQALALPRVDIIKQAIRKSLVVKVADLREAMDFSNEYAPEHLILHLEDSAGAVKSVNNAGSVFVGAFSPESCGDYASGTNHTLPTYGYAKQFSGVNTLSFQKHITSQELTKEGLRNLGPVVVTLAECEGLEAHANAVRVRLAALRVEAETRQLFTT